MGKWNEVRERFKADRFSAVRRNERSGKELQLVQAKQNDHAIDSEIRAARMALAHYRAATDIESSFDKGRA